MNKTASNTGFSSIVILQPTWLLDNENVCSFFIHTLKVKDCWNWKSTLFFLNLNKQHIQTINRYPFSCHATLFHSSCLAVLQNKNKRIVKQVLNAVYCKWKQKVSIKHRVSSRNSNEWSWLFDIEVTDRKLSFIKEGAQIWIQHVFRKKMSTLFIVIYWYIFACIDMY